MPEIGRLRFVSTGYGGAPGLNTFYFFPSGGSTFTATDAANARAAVEAFFTAAKPVLSNNYTVTSDGLCDRIDVSSGAIVGSVNPGTPVAVAGSGGVNYGPLASAACISWITGFQVGRRLLRGRSFISPLANPAFGGDGRLTASAVSTLSSAGNALIAAASADLAIWHRPKPLTSGNNGQASSAITLKINQNGAVLRSRRQ